MDMPNNEGIRKAVWAFECCIYPITAGGCRECCESENGKCHFGMINSVRVPMRLAEKMLKIAKLFRDMKKEAGDKTGGHSMADGWMVDHDSSGFRITNLRGGERFYFTWAQVASKIGAMVGMERFLSEEDRERMNRIIMDHGGEIPRPIAAYKYPYE